MLSDPLLGLLGRVRAPNTVEKETTVCVTVTHNGDFDAFELYGQGVPNGTLGLWLGRVLHHWNTAKGDSPKFAGLMDLLVCQGRWVASVRYAFLKVTLSCRCVW